MKKKIVQTLEDLVAEAPAVTETSGPPASTSLQQPQWQLQFRNAEGAFPAETNAALR